MEISKACTIPAVIVTDWETILHTNSIFPEITGLDEKSLIDGRITKYLYPVDIWITIRENSQGTANFFDLCGQQKQFRISCVDSDSSSIITFEDITSDKKVDPELKVTLNRLHESLHYSTNFFGTGPVPLYFMDTEGNFLIK